MIRTEIIEANFDGSGKNVKDTLLPTGVGVTVRHRGKEVIALAHNAGLGSSNDAEWIACTLAMKACLLYARTLTASKIKIRIYGDSRLVINQFYGNWAINKPSFMKYRKIAQKHHHGLGDMLQFIKWVPREENKRADHLSKKGRAKKHQTLTI